MKKKVLALGLAMVMCLSLSMTAFAASSSTGGNSGDQKQEEQKQEEQKPTPTPTPAKETPKPVKDVVDKTPAGGTVKPEAVKVVVPSADGTAKAVTLDKVIEQKKEEVKQVVAGAAAALTAGSDATASINNILSSPASPMFTQTVEALAQMKGSEMVVNNMGTVKTAATAQDALGNTIASAGVIKNVTPGALVMLMSINADGTIEYVEGIVDPLTGSVIGAFKGVPTVITVMVLA